MAEPTTQLQQAMQEVDKSLEGTLEVARVPIRRDDSLKGWMRAQDQKLDQLAQMIARRLDRIERFLGIGD